MHNYPLLKNRALVSYSFVVNFADLIKFKLKVTSEDISSKRLNMKWLTHS